MPVDARGMSAPQSWLVRRRQDFAALGSSDGCRLTRGWDRSAEVGAADTSYSGGVCSVCCSGLLGLALERKKRGALAQRAPTPLQTPGWRRGAKR